MDDAELRRMYDAHRACLDGTATLEDLLIRAESELRFACNPDACVCSDTAMRASIALKFVRLALETVNGADTRS